MQTGRKSRTIVIQIIIGLIIFLILLAGLGKIFTPKNQKTYFKDKDFYSLQRDSAEVVMIGTSSIRAAVSPLFLWDEYGITSHSRTNALQAPEVTYLSAVEAIEYQHPKVILMNAMYLFEEYDVDGRKEPFLHIALDRKKWSFEKLKAIHSIVSRSDEQTYFDYLFPLVRFHSRWSELGTEDLHKDSGLDPDKYRYLRGQNAEFTVMDKPVNLDVMNINDPTAKKTTTDYEIFTKTVQYCKDNGVEVLLTAYPAYDWNYTSHKITQEFADENDIEFIDFNEPQYLDSLGIDARMDFYDEKHVNIAGSKKITHFLGQYLAENYGLPSRKVSKEVAEQFDKDVKTLEKKIAKRGIKVDF